MRAYKFYSKRWGLEALYRRRLKITAEPELNDPFEFGAASSGRLRDRRAFRKWKKDMFSEHGLICFSKGWNNPVIWSHYAESHKGLALGFDIQDDIAIEVKYSKDRLKVPKNPSNVKKPSVGPSLNQRMVKTKFHHWEYEDEVRVIQPLSEEQFENGHYFEPFEKQFSLKEVIFGAYYKSGNNQNLHKELLSEGINFITARLGILSFSVVPQKDARRLKHL